VLYVLVVNGYNAEPRRPPVAMEATNVARFANEDATS
jgi:hypothetical protein